jgi:transmembrane sensor
MNDVPSSLEAGRALTPVEAAARWMAQEDRNEALLGAWLDEAEDNRAAWRKAQSVWGVFDDAKDDAMIAAMTRAARSAASETRFEALPKPANDRLWPKLLATAAAAMVVITFAGLGLRGHWSGSEGPTINASTEGGQSFARFGTPDYVTAKGQMSSISLPDGTRVTLAPESALDLGYANGERRLRLLSGRGYFDVAHDAVHPFTVEAADRVVTALGTHFDIQMKPGGMRVVLAQGSVAITAAPGGLANQPMVQLRPGEAFVASGAKPGKVRTTDLEHDLAWRQGFAVFENRPLAEVIETLNRSTRAQIFIRDPKVAALRVTGQFRTGDIERFGRALALVLPVRISARDSDRYEIVHRRSP